jgi:hypothetical protein
MHAAHDNHFSAELRGCSSESDLTELEEVDASPKRGKMTKAVNTTEDLDLELSDQEGHSADGHDSCDIYEKEYEELDSEEDARTYSAYHNSDSEISDTRLEKKQSHQVKGSKVETGTSRGKEDRSALSSDTVRFFESLLPSTRRLT